MLDIKARSTEMKRSAFCVFWENNAKSINNSKNKQKDISCQLKKNPNPLQSYRSTHETNSKLKSSTDVTGAHRRSRSDWLNFCNSVRIYILSWCEGSDSLISHLRGSVTFCDKPDVPKIETFQLAERPKSATCDTLATTKSIPFRASIGIRGFSVKDAINQMLVMNIIISVLSSWLLCCWRLGVNAILAEVVFLLLIIILLSWRFAIFFGRFSSVGTPSLFISVYNLTFSVEMWGENKKKKCIITRGFIIFCLSASLVVILEFL